MSKMKAQEAKLNVKMLVRDKDGNPKFRSQEAVNIFWNVLSDKDKAYLIKQFNLEK